MSNKGITLIALVITIIILLILAGVTIVTLTGGDGILNKANIAKEENQEKTATEIINLKITNIQLQSYQEGKMLDLQYLADQLYEDEEIQYIDNESKKDINTEKEKIIITGESVFTKLKDYPYEFEIGASLYLISINGKKIETDTSKSEQIRKLSESVSKLEMVVQNLKESSEMTLIESEWKKTDKVMDANKWNILEEISLANYGKGKAIISYTVSNQENKASSLSIDLLEDNEILGTDLGLAPLSVDWLRASTTASISYDENTKITFRYSSDKSYSPGYTYSILLIPD